ncbi:MAG: RNA methyltransferase [Bacilli bacterium]|jgi:TrmH family RNA methyltransferase
MIKTITSATNPLIKRLHALKSGKGPDSETSFLVYGYHLVSMALQFDHVETIIASKPLEGVKDKIDQIIVPDHIIQKLSGQVSPQDVLAVCRQMNEAPLSGKCIAYLDGVNDPGNLGTILRSAAAFGIDLVMLGKECASRYNQKTVAASQGALFSVATRQGNEEDLHELKTRGYRFVGTVLDETAVPLKDFRYPDQCVMFFGSEGHGLRPELVARLDHKIIIPMAHIESLNVAMAAAIVFYDMKYR